MKRKYLIVLVFVLIFTPLFTVPVKGSASWGIETDTKYEFELANFNFVGTDYAKFLSAQFNVYIKFIELNNTGYTYTVYNSTNDNELSTNSTVFEEVQAEETSYVVPSGLPIALPLEYNSIPYLNYAGQMVNETSSLVGFDELFNLTEFDENTTLDIYSTIDTDYLKLYGNLYTPKVNETLLETLSEMLSGGDTGGIPLQIPNNLTDFKLNLTISYNASIGLFNSINLRIRSTSTDEFGYTDDFNVDFKYAWDAPTPPPPTDPGDDNTETTDTNFPWLTSLLSSIFVVSLTILNKKRKKSI